MATQTTNLHLTKPDGSEKVNIATINTNMDTIDTYAGTNNASIINLAEDIGVVVNGNKTKSGVTAAVGQYVILKNSTISNRADGLYTAAKAIPANTAIDASYLTAVSGGGLNALNDKIGSCKIINQKYYGSATTLATVLNDIDSAIAPYAENGVPKFMQFGYMSGTAGRSIGLVDGCFINVYFNSVALVLVEFIGMTLNEVNYIKKVTNWGSAIESSLNAKIPKCVYSEKTSSSVSGNSNGSVVIDMPNDATEILSIIPFGYNPGSSWDTQIAFSGVPNISTRTINFRTIGNTTQPYGIKALVIYK